MNRRKFAMALGYATAGLAVGSALLAEDKPGSEGGKETKTKKKAKASKHECKGANACKGQGGCKTSDNGCRGRNSCKGKGGCTVTRKKN